MPRGSRKSNKEKLLDRQKEIMDSISQYKAAVKDLETQAHAVEEELKRIELSELSSMMEENHLTPEMLREMIESHVSHLENIAQGA